MSKKAVSIFIVALLAVVIGVAAFAKDKEKDKKKLTKEQVPKAVITAFEKAYPKVTVKEYEEKTKEAKVFYEIEFTEGMATHEVKYTADGTLVSTEEDIPPKGLPEAVTKAIEKKYPDAKITKVEKETKGEKVKYEVTLTVKGKEMEVKFNDKGEELAKEKK